MEEKSQEDGVKSSRVPAGTGPLLFSSDVLGAGRCERGGATETKTLPAHCGIAGPAAAERAATSRWQHLLSSAFSTVRLRETSQSQPRVPRSR